MGLIGLLALALSGTLRAKLRVWLSKNLFQYRYDYREEWLSFTRALSTHRSPEDLNQQVIRSLADMVESPGGALWMRDLSGGQIVQVAKWNSPAVDTAEPADSALTQFMVQSGWVINLSEFRQHPENYEGLWLPQWLVNLPQAWLLVPLRVGQDLIGFVVLANSRTTWELDWEGIDLLKTASSQAAGVLAQMQATAALQIGRAHV